MGTNKIIAVVVLLLVIAAAVLVTVRRKGAAAQPPREVMDRKAELISVDKPFTVGEFTLAQIEGAQPDPKTGYRTIEGKQWAAKITCVSCGKAIPREGSGGQMGGPGGGRSDYACPLCGKPAYESGPREGGRGRGQLPLAGQ